MITLEQATSIADLHFGERRIAAIKELRNAEYLGLKESKDLLEELARGGRDHMIRELVTKFNPTPLERLAMMRTDMKRLLDDMDKLITQLVREGDQGIQQPTEPEPTVARVWFDRTD